MAGLDVVIGDKIGLGRCAVAVFGKRDMDIADRVVGARNMFQHLAGKADELVRRSLIFRVLVDMIVGKAGTDQRPVAAIDALAIAVQDIPDFLPCRQLLQCVHSATLLILPVVII